MPKKTRVEDFFDKHGTIIFVAFSCFMLGIIFYVLVFQEGRLDRVQKVVEEQAKEFCIEQGYDGLTDIYIVQQIYYRIICYKIENYNFTHGEYDIYMKQFEYSPR